MQAQILKLLDQLKDHLNMALLLITHDLGVVRKWLIVCVMTDGNLVEQATTGELFSNLSTSTPAINCRGTEWRTSPCEP